MCRIGAKRPKQISELLMTKSRRNREDNERENLIGLDIHVETIENRVNRVVDYSVAILERRI